MRIGTFFSVPLRVSGWFFLMIAIFGPAGYYHNGIQGAAAGLAVLFMVYTFLTMHEYGHVVAGQFMGFKFSEVVLGAFGGVAKCDIDDNLFVPTIRQEFLTTLFGPFVNAVWFAFLWAFFVYGGLYDEQVALASKMNYELLQHGPVNTQVSTWASVSGDMNDINDFVLMGVVINAVMLVFNLIPMFPMDGGRLFRCFLRVCGMNYSRATIFSTHVSQIIACALMVFTFYNGIYSAGLVCVFIGFVAYLARKREYGVRSMRHFMESVERAKAAVNDAVNLCNIPRDDERIDSFAVTDNGDTLCEIEMCIVVAAAKHLNVPLDDKLLFELPMHVGGMSPLEAETFSEQLSAVHAEQFMQYYDVSANLRKQVIRRLSMGV